MREKSKPTKMSSTQSIQFLEMIGQNGFIFWEEEKLANHIV